MRFLAFDSFAGLPPTSSQPTLELWHQPGVLATPVAEFRRLVDEHDVYADRVETHAGFYDASLTPALQRKLLERGSRISLVTIDCDLYESAVSVFRFIEPLLQEGSILYLDDLLVGYKASPVKGVARAFLEFQQTSRFKYLRHIDVAWWGRSYVAYEPDPTAPEGVI
jgi:O-methyltransferase